MKRSKNIDERKRAKWLRSGALADINGPIQKYRRSYRHLGVVITVAREGDSYTAYFSNAVGEYFPLHLVKAIRGVKGRKEALRQGIAFVDAHQCQFIEKIGDWQLFVRLWWDEKWGYVLDGTGKLINHPEDCASRGDAIEKGRARARAEDEKFEREMAEIGQRLAKRRAALAEDKPAGTFKCLACERLCDGSELVLDPMGTAVNWICSDFACGANVVKVADAPYARG